MPYIGIELPADLARLVRDWDYLPEEIRSDIVNTAKKNMNPRSEAVIMVAA